MIYICPECNAVLEKGNSTTTSAFNYYGHNVNCPNRSIIIITSEKPNKIIYISGAITNNPHFLEDFNKAEEYLKAQGYEVINPAKTNATLPPLNHSDYMKVCRPLVEIADCIYLLKGWEQSKGARMERDWAVEMGKEIKEEE